MQEDPTSLQSYLGSAGGDFNKAQEQAKSPAPMSLTEKISRQAEAIKNLQQALDNTIKRLNILEQMVGER